MALEPPTMGEALARCVHREPHSTSEVWAPASRGHLRVDLARGASTHFHPGLGTGVPSWPPRGGAGDELVLWPGRGRGNEQEGKVWPGERGEECRLKRRDGDLKGKNGGGERR